MLNNEDINEINKTLEYIMVNEPEIDGAYTAMLDFIAPKPEDKRMEYIGNLLYGRNVAIERSGGDLKQMITDGATTKMRLDRYNDELMDQLHYFFWMACHRQGFTPPEDIRSDTEILMYYIDNQWNPKTIKSNPKEAGYGFYSLIKNMMVDQ